MSKGPLVEVSCLSMDYGETDQRPSHDGPRNRYSSKMALWRGSRNALQEPLADSHERYHSMHYENMERGTVTVSDDDDDAEWERQPKRSKSGHLEAVVQDLQKKLEALENRFKLDPSNLSRIPTIPNDPAMANGNDEDFTSEQKSSADQRLLDMVPELHETSWSNFMNKSQDEKKEYAIEVLTDEPDYLVKSAKKKAGKDKVLEAMLHRLEDHLETTPTTSPAVEEIPPVPDRIRINSLHILSALATIDKTVDHSAPMLMFRPYKLLVHHEDKIRAIVHHLQHGTTSPDTPASTDHSAETQRLLEQAVLHETAGRKDVVLLHLQCLIQFMDQYVKPTVTRLQGTSCRKVAFRDLWYLFPPGEDILMPVKDRQNNVSMDPLVVSPEMFHGRYEKNWRVIGAGGGRPNLVGAQDREQRLKLNPFRIRCYYVDFDGVYFCPIVHAFSIQPYRGERDITTLDFFPFRFLKKGKEYREKSLEEGKLIFNALLRSHTHFYYCGPSLITHPCGCPIPGIASHQDHVESEVIVDYRTTLLKYPSWRPLVSFWKPPPSYPDEFQENYPISIWTDAARTKRVGIESDQVYNDTVVDQERALAFKDKARIFNAVPDSWLSNEKSVPEADVGMLSPRVFAFVLRTRSFVPLWLRGLREITAQNDGLRNLQLRDPNFKDTIHALVRTHFLNRKVQKTGEHEHELVRGKARGLVFLLHGAPGVGKTFTAESVAAANGRPLFQITCGDLGLTPVEVERALQEIFRYAQLWNCVLLLDECDIFLTQRTRNDLKRNSLVSVFLRVLEWYTGVLFLTTNRVGMLDSAVKSRITWSTYYPPLDLTQTTGIWKTNLGLLKKRNPDVEVDKKGIMLFAHEHFRNSQETGCSWNGRQIQNAFKVAVSLADWETFSNERKQAMDTTTTEKQTRQKLKVTADHFQTIADAAETFDDYLLEATGLSEAQRAFNAQERADGYADDVQDDINENMTTLQEPIAKRRTSSMVGGRPSAYGVNVGQNEVSQNSGRWGSSSKSQQPQPPLRKSTLQPGGSSQSLWPNGGIVKSPRGASGSGNATSPVQGLASYEFSAAKKRKRSEPERYTGHRAKNSSPGYSEHSDETPGSGSDDRRPVTKQPILDSEESD